MANVARVDSITTTIKTQFEGIHCYPDAPDEVSFLRYPHRHIFHVIVELDVFDDDREIEFIMAKHKLNKWLEAKKDFNGVVQMGTTSCEQMAKAIITFMADIVPSGNKREIFVTVMEDGENGATAYGQIY